MTLYCQTCKVLRTVDIYDFLKSHKTQIVCGICANVLMTLQELYEELDYSDIYNYWEV